MKVFFYSSQGYECLLSVARWYEVLDERKAMNIPAKMPRRIREAR